MEANKLGQLRTGATTGVAARHLAREDADAMGLFGSGWQAASQLEAVAAVRPLRRAVVYSRDPERRADFARRMSAQLELEVVPAEQPRAAAEGLPIVVTATSSHEPVLQGRWLAPGALLAAIGSNWLNKTELDSEAVTRAAHVVCDDVDCCRHEAGDFTAALAQGLFSWDDAVPLADVVAGKHAGRSDPDEIVLFKSVGMALEDVAVGHTVLQRAREQGVGQELPF